MNKSLLLLFCCLSTWLLNAQNAAPSSNFRTEDNFEGDIITETVLISTTTKYTYYSAMGWNAGQDGGGYCGLQDHPDGNNYIFSIWDPSNGEKITAPYVNPGTRVENFGGEGTGLKSWNFDLGWQPNQWYTLVTRRWDVGTHTHFGFWVQDKSGNKWTHLVTMDFPMSNIKFKSSTVAFIEDWLGTGHNEREYELKQGFKRRTDGTWFNFSKGYFSANQEARSKNYTNNFDAGVKNGSYYLRIGGNTQPSFSGTRTTLTNNSFGNAPDHPNTNFSIKAITTNKIEWDIPISSTPQFKYTIYVNDQIAQSNIDSEVRSATINAQTGDIVKIVIEDILGRENSKTQTISNSPTQTKDTLAAGNYYIYSERSKLKLHPENANAGASIKQVNSEADEWKVIALGGGKYNIQNVRTLLFMDINGGSKENGGDLIQWNENNGINQQFFITRVGDGVYVIKSVNSEKCIDVFEGSVENGANVLQWSCHEGTNQQWRFEPTEKPDKCAAKGGDKDGDGICAVDDCNDNDANIGAKKTLGTACDDGNGNTNNDRIQADGCTCQGTLITEPNTSNLKEGRYRIYNVNSNLELTPENYGANAGASIKQIETNADTWNIMPLGGDKFTIRNARSQLLLDINGGSKDNGGDLIQWTETNGTNQQFYIKSVGDNLFEIKSVSSGKCLDVDGGSKTNEANVFQWDCHQGTNQQWRFEPTEKPDKCAAKGGDKDGDGICAVDDCNDNDANIGAKKTPGTACDDGNGNTNNDRIQADGCTCQGTLITEPNTSNLKEGRYRIYNVNSNLELTPENYGANAGASIKQIETNADTWNITPLGGDKFTIRNARSQLLLDINGGSKDNGGDLIQWTETNGTNQQFYIKSVGDNLFEIKSVSSGKCLDVEGASKANGANVFQWDCGGSANQKWRFEPYEPCKTGCLGGFPNTGFSEEQVGTIFSQNNTGKAISAVAMHNGYLFVPMGRDGGGKGEGAFAFYDISDPVKPKSVFNSRDFSTKYHTKGTLNYVGNWAEIHSLPIIGNKMVISEIGHTSASICIFDASDFPNKQPEIIGRYNFPGVTNPDGYNGNTFSPACQGGRYVYAPTGTNGLHIVDIADPTNPVGIRHIPKSQLSNLDLRSAVVIGNLLILSTVAVHHTGTVLIMDITDPANPVQIGSIPNIRFGYQGFVYGSEFFPAGDGPLTGYDFSDPKNITSRVYNNNAGNVFHNPEYGFGKDDFIFVGHYPGMTKWDRSQANTPLVAKIEPKNPASDDYAFITPIGNLMVVASDHNHPNRFSIGVHQSGKDDQPPVPNFVLPKDKATNVHTKTKIGISFTDFVDALSLNTNTLQIIPRGSTAPIAGTYSQMFGFVNFLPDQELKANTIYDVILKANGVKDWAGNVITKDQIVTSFSTGATIPTTPIFPTLNPTKPITVNQAVTFSLESKDNEALYSWDFGDGSPRSAPSKNKNISHTYAKPGNFTVSLHAQINTGETIILSTVQIVHNPIANSLPLNSSSIIFDASNQLIWNVNPDNHSVSAIDALNNSLKFEIKVGENPQSLALGPNNMLWVVNKKSATISLLDRKSGNLKTTYKLPNASEPHAIIVDQTRNVAYISLEATGKIARLNLLNGNILNTIEVGENPRYMALDPQKNQLWVSLFISPDDGGKVKIINADQFTLAKTINLALSTNADSPDNGRGLPNYLGAFALSPDLKQGFIPSKKDNVERGTFRDGQALTFEHTVRSMGAQVDMTNLTENINNRVDFDNNDFATAAVYSPLGNRIFVTTNGSSFVWILDAYEPNNKSSIISNGLAPRGLAMNTDGSRLYVHNYLSRSVSIFNTADVCAASCGTMAELTTVKTVGQEHLSPLVLKGKQLFYNSADSRISQESYMSCASCHLDGGQDGRVWDFTSSKEGLRNTIDLRGKKGMEHGRLHWTANFDEVHDFENQIRSLNRGSGLMSDADFEATKDPLGNPKAGKSADLDAIAAYISSLDEFGISPYRTENEELSPQAIKGKQIFFNKKCNDCHSGKIFTDSPSNSLHDIGTIKTSSGKRIGAKLSGFDTPTLKGLWKTAPYLHDGSAKTIAEAIKAHNNVGIADNEMDDLVAYLQQIDDLEDGECDMAGQSCDDGDANTDNDLIQPDNCICKGTPNACANKGGDADKDGVCDEDDCQPNDPNYPKPFGSVCDDGDDNTIDDKIQEDGCTCAGTNASTGNGMVTQTCGGNTTITYGNGTIIMSGKEEEHYFQVFDENWQVVFNCGWLCGNTKTVSNFPNGTYFVFIKNSSYQNVCTQTIILKGGATGGNVIIDKDKDGVEEKLDCNDNDPNLTTIGAFCDDGNPNTIDDEVTANCTCEGVARDTSEFITESCDGNTSISYGKGEIRMSGKAEVLYFQVFDQNWQQVFNCSWLCDNNQSVSGLKAGRYRVFIKDEHYQIVCEKLITLKGNTGNTGNTGGGTTPNTGITCGEVSVITRKDSLILKGQNGNDYFFKINDINNGWKQVAACSWSCGDEFLATQLPSSKYLITIYNFDWSVHCSKEIDLTNSLVEPSSENRNKEQFDLLTFPDNRSVAIQWFNNNGYKVLRFEVEYAKDGVHFKKLDQFFNKKWTDKLEAYQAIDKTPKMGRNYYRVKKIYLDGSFAYTKTQAIDFNINLDAIEVFPNPASKQLFINLKQFKGKSGRLVLTNHFGQVIKEISPREIKNELTQINTSQLINGVYYLKVMIGQRSFTKKILIYNNY